MPSGKAIATLIVFALSTFFVIYPVVVPLRFPYLGRRRVPINLTSAPIIAIAVLWASQCLGPGQIRDGIVGTDGVKPYNILILFFSLAYMAITLDITGILQSAAFWVSNKGGSHGRRLYLYFYVMLTLLSVFLGNDPVILSGTAFLVYYTKINELDPTSWLMSQFAAANTASMVLFVGNPTNVVICEGFAINNAAFTAYTIFPFLGCIVICFVALLSQFYSSKHIPRRLPRAEALDPRSVLLDPKGAWVGSILLGTCLVVIITVSFFHIDVWKISLPFALAKFIFDLGWDYYRPDVHRTLRGNGLSQPVSIKRKRSNENMELYRIGAGKHHKDPVNQAVTQEDPTHTSVNELQAPSASITTLQDTSPNSKPHKHCSSAKGLRIIVGRQQLKFRSCLSRLKVQFPTVCIAFPRLPFALVPFAFSQFILIEGLAHQGWIGIFSNWLVKASNKQVYPTIWLVGVLGVVLCNISGTNIGATILLTKIVRAARFDSHGNLAAAIALAVASNVGAVSFTFSASLAGLLWRDILRQKGIFIKQRSFAFWNLLPLVAMTVVGLGVVCAEMAALTRSGM
ncbi:hypothetical protein BDN72DRAFT_774429 [Pluteus cervinus]|uniref:Uncharacterized protein n=1 Tax=Pluteus cervinus TaxID=181527 RepID=A0ACD3AFN5_9AGAR|nr:hypothetical protein BDN72DRAFT_774429 [Pluteus cervinus]